MTLFPGTRIGEYEIVGALGFGGMGEVYRARDSRLGRDVAIKILPRAFATDRDRLKRFEREARLLAALSHPNIAAIYGLEDDRSTSVPSPALVLELIEGETLRDRIAHGPIRGPEAFKIARQIADALEAAHRQGIVHRDLKPENIRITPSGMVKVLDFGLAKAFAEANVDRDPDGSEFATVTSPNVTTPGMVVGTPAYMSPEQARGQAVDERTDLWAFGCVLYEMLTGLQPFPGATFADNLAAIVEREPDWSVLPLSAPSLLRRLLRRCLQKDVRERLQSAGDARLDLEELVVNPVDVAVSTARGSPARWLNLILVGSLAIATVALAAMAFRSRPPVPEVRFELSGGPELTPAASVAISPDGRQIAVAPTFEQNAALWLRSVDSVAGQTLAGTEGAFLPFWSPDGRSIGFFANRKLQKVDIESGVVTVIADAPVGRGAAWATDGTIVFAPSVSGPLRKVAAAGGAVSPLTTLDKGQNDHRAPQFLPDERHFLYYARGTPQVRGVFLVNRDGTDPKRLIDADAPAVFASGQLLFVRNHILYAQTLDVDRLEVRGAPVAIADSVAVEAGVSLATLATSPAGAIAYGTAASRRAQFAWFDRGGKRIASVGTPDTDGGSPSLSPDGRLLAFNRVVAGNWDIWTLDIERAVMNRITSGTELDFAPIWTPDGRHLVFQSARGQGSDLFLRAIDGSGRDERIVSSPFEKNPTDISRDGQVLIYDANSPETSSDIWMVSLNGDHTPRPIVQTPFIEREGQLSPDGHWLAYTSNETGRLEVYIRPFPGEGSRVPVSSGGGNQLRWGRHGTELFYVDTKSWLNVVPITLSPAGTVSVGKPAQLFETPFLFSSPGPRAGYVVSDDGQRFLLSAPLDAARPSTIVVILNWRGRA